MINREKKEQKQVFVYKYTRKPVLIQYQITDYCGKQKRIEFLMRDRKQYREARKTMKLQKKPQARGRPKTLDLKKFLPLSHYCISCTPEPMRPDYLIRFPQITPCNLNLAENPLSPYEIVLYSEITEFQGFFDDVFLFNDLTHFDEVERCLNKDGIRTGAPCLRDMLIYKFACIQSGNQYYEGFIRNLRFFGDLTFRRLIREPHFIPSVQDFSRMFHAVPPRVFKDYFFQLVQELLEERLLSFKIMMWDCQFVHSNSSDYKDKRTKKYSDPDAGLGVHNNKFLGVGYMCSTLYLYCGDLIVPVFCELFPA